MYLNNMLNDSPTVVIPANAALSAVGMKAYAANSSGKAILPAAAGDVPLGIALADQTDVAAGEDIFLAVKDITHWIAGEALAVGDLLMAHTDGTAKKATSGKYIFAKALEAADKDQPAVVQIINAGYAA